MSQRKSLHSYVRTAAAACFGLTPHSTTEQTEAAICTRLGLRNATDVLDQPTTGTDPVINRLVAAGQLLLTDPTDRTLTMRRAIAFSATDSQMPDHARQFQLAKAPAVAGEQLVLVDVG